MPAPPCEKQGKFTTSGETTDYPHVRARVAPYPRQCDGALRTGRAGRRTAPGPRAARRGGRAPACARVLALRLEPSTAVETLVGKRSESYRATEVYRERFGDHAIVVLVRGDLANLVLTDNLGRLLGLEGCLSGNKPQGPAGAGRAEVAVRGVRAHEAGQGGLRAGHLHQLGGRGDQRPVPAAARQQAAGGRAREAGGAQARARPGAGQGRAGEGGEGRRAARLRPVHARPADAQCALRARGCGGSRGSTIPTSSRRSCSTRSAARRRRRRASPTSSPTRGRRSSRCGSSPT